MLLGASRAKRPGFSFKQVRSLLFDLEDEEKDQPMNHPDESKLGG